MAQCVAVAADGTVQASAAEPCTTLVLLTPAEYAATASPWSLSVDDAYAVGWMVGAVWLIAWGCRVLADTVREVTSPGRED